MLPVRLLDIKLRLLQHIVGTPANRYMMELVDLFKALSMELSLEKFEDCVDMVNDPTLGDFLPEYICSMQLFKQLLIGLGSLGSSQGFTLSILPNHGEAHLPTAIVDLDPSSVNLYSHLLRTCCKTCLDRYLATGIKGSDLLKFLLADAGKTPLLSTDDRKYLILLVSGSIFSSAEIACPFCTPTSTSTSGLLQFDQVLGQRQDEVDNIRKLSADFEIKHTSQFLGYNISPTGINFPIAAMTHLYQSKGTELSQSMRTSSVLDTYLHNSIVIDERDSITIASEPITVIDSRPVVELSRVTATSGFGDEPANSSGANAVELLDTCPVTIPTTAKQQTDLSYLSELPIACGITPTVTPGIGRRMDQNTLRLDHMAISNRSPSPIHCGPQPTEPVPIAAVTDFYEVDVDTESAEDLPFSVGTAHATKELSLIKRNAHINTVVTKERQDKTSSHDLENRNDTAIGEEVMITSLSCIVERIPKIKSSSGTPASSIQKLDKIKSKEEAHLSLSSPSPSDVAMTSPQPVTVIKVRDSTLGVGTDIDCCNISIASAQPDSQDPTMKRISPRQQQLCSPRTVAVRITKRRDLSSSKAQVSNAHSPQIKSPPSEQTYTVTRIQRAPLVGSSRLASESGPTVPAEANTSVAGVNLERAHELERGSIAYTVSSAIHDAIKLNPMTAILKVDSIKIDCSLKDNKIESIVSGTVEECVLKDSFPDEPSNTQCSTASVRDSLSSSLPVVPRPPPTAGVAAISVRAVFQGEQLDGSDTFQELTGSVRRQPEDRAESPLVTISAHPSNYASPTLPTSPLPSAPQVILESVQEETQANQENPATTSSISESPLPRKSQIYIPPRNEKLTESCSPLSRSQEAKPGNPVPADQEESLKREPTPDLSEISTTSSHQQQPDTVCTDMDAPKETRKVATDEDTISPGLPAPGTESINSPALQDLQDVLREIGNSINSRGASRAASPSHGAHSSGVQLVKAIPILVDMLDATEALIPRATAQASVMNIEVSIDEVNGMSSIYDQVIEVEPENELREQPSIRLHDTVMSPSQLEVDRMQPLNEVHEAMQDTTIPLQGVNPEDVGAALTLELQKEVDEANTRHSHEDSAEEIFLNGTPVTKAKAKQEKVKRGMCGSRSVSKSGSRLGSRAGSRAISRTTSEIHSEAPSAPASTRASRRLGKIKLSSTANVNDSCSDTKEPAAPEPNGSVDMPPTSPQESIAPSVDLATE
ncbi:hypothetical protein QR46_2423 [Giardia duodenalis assemblage B]|uniref:Uncharacterized protein n=1 Tax=Giardia duodenalis assemblage B TaxID=1394984 RepID=A0A132NU63_GIAIN|nr:hypothetical protein QR46_2423 [Giardia intestinalis assemblage B]